MPGEISRCHSGPTDACPYVPEWCYDPPGPKMCKCGCHEGYHNDAGVCLRARKCGCTGFSEKPVEGADCHTPNPRADLAAHLVRGTVEPVVQCLNKQEEE